MNRFAFFIVVFLLSSICAEETTPQWLLEDETVEEESVEENSVAEEKGKRSSRSRSNMGGFGYHHWGLGGNISLCFPERPIDLGFGFALGGHIEFRFDRIGAIQYVPTVAYWFSNDETSSTANFWTTENFDHDAQLALNLFDLKYIPPLPIRLPISPYLGLGLTICIHFYEWSWTTYTPVGVVSSSGRGKGDDSSAGFNIFIGTDFPINDKWVPMVEFRYTANRDVRVLRITGGISYCF